MLIDERPSYFRNFAHEILYVSLICSAQLLFDAAGGNVLVPLHIISADMGITNPAKLPWASAAYVLTVGIFILITGRLGDIYGHKTLFITGFTILSVFSAFVGLGAYVKNDVYFFLMRGFQGIGPAALLPNGIALLARAYRPGKRKSLVFAMFGAIIPLGFLMGALFGSIFAQLLWWPWGQWVLAFVCAFLAIASVFIIPQELAPAVCPTGKTDILGATTGVSGLVLFIYCWNEAPVVGWDKPYVYVLLIVSVLLVGLFIIVEMKTEEPIMPLSMWSVKGFPGVLACIALGWSSFGILIYYNIQFLQIFRGASPLLTTAMLSPVFFSGVAATIFVGLVYDRVPAHVLLMTSMLCFCIASILLATMPIHQTYWAQEFVAIVVAPFGGDICFPAASLIVSNRMPIHQQGVAASMVTTAINWSIAFGLGIAETVTIQLLKRRHTLLQGYRGGFYVAIGLSGTAVIIAFLFCRVPPPVKGSKGKDQLEFGVTPTSVAIIDTGFTQGEEPEGESPITDYF